MVEFSYWFFLGVLGLVFFVLFLFASYSLKEKERFAVKRSFVAMLILGILIFMLKFVSGDIFPFLSLFACCFGVLVFLKFGNSKVEIELPSRQFDERDVMFSRAALEKGTENFNSYYQMRTENRDIDDDTRKEPGLLQEGSVFYNKLLFSAANATFSAVNLLQPLVEGETFSKKTAFKQTDISSFIKNWTQKLGAADVGFTLLQKHHVYSHIGRGSKYGEEVKLDHKFAIAFTVEMSHEFLSFNPKGPVVMESAQQYLNAGSIAVQLAQFLRNLGYDARAHIDANYRLICPVVAMDAGLGGIGRMGLLITPNYGPRVRLGVVTTNLELNVNAKPLDPSVNHFCEICKKCATNCPSKSISNETAKREKKWKRWTINHDTCFKYWCKVGTDCGRCVAICPYAHPNNFIHNLIRWAIKRNSLNRFFALKLDDFFYGRKPSIKKPEKWMNAAIF